MCFVVSCLVVLFLQLTRRRTRGNLRDGARYCLLAGTLDGGLGAILPVDERVFRRLYALQGIMSNALGHNGAANPRYYRRAGFVEAGRMGGEGSAINCGVGGDSSRLHGEVFAAQESGVLLSFFFCFCKGWLALPTDVGIGGGRAGTRKIRRAGGASLG